ncbi:MAG TPA: hypothetical protein VM100_12215 [Longimicrobiales bacterium]|nr:hypothetical protein [Longimicrobiales bacterium]
MAAMDRIPEDVARIKISDLAGQEHALGATWATKPAVLAFVRHFG